MLALGHEVTGSDVADTAATSPEDMLPCYDMASALSGDFVADGEVNLFDLSLQLRMIYGSMDMAEQYMVISDTAADVKNTSASAPLTFPRARWVYTTPSAPKTVSPNSSSSSIWGSSSGFAPVAAALALN